MSTVLPEVVGWVVVAALALLGAAAAIVLRRIFAGPSNLDRIIASEILLVIVIAGVALESGRQKTSTYLPLLMILGLVGFVGGVAVTRFLSRDTDEADEPGGTDRTWAPEDTDETDRSGDTGAPEPEPHAKGAGR